MFAFAHSPMQFDFSSGFDIIVQHLKVIGKFSIRITEMKLKFWFTDLQSEFLSRFLASALHNLSVNSQSQDIWRNRVEICDGFFLRLKTCRCEIIAWFSSHLSTFFAPYICQISWKERKKYMTYYKHYDLFLSQWVMLGSTKKLIFREKRNIFCQKPNQKSDKSN